MRWLAGVCLVAVLAASCPDRTPDTRTVTVLAAASLTDAFIAIGEDFEAAHPGARVRFSFGPSDALATQIIEGAPADVFASASPVWMDAVEAEGPTLASRADFARNSLVIITPDDDPGRVSAVEDLASPGVSLVLAAPGVPAGDYARAMLNNAGIRAGALANLVSNEEDVKGVVQKVLLGEVDAGVVYRTDVTDDVAHEVRTVEIPKELNVIATYPIAVVAGRSTGGMARAFVDLVLGDGRDVLRSFGFLVG